MRRGRPLRFLALVLGGWTTARVIALWPVSPVPPVAATPIRGADGFARTVALGGVTPTTPILVILPGESRSPEATRIIRARAVPVARSGLAPSSHLEGNEPTNTADAAPTSTQFPVVGGTPFVVGGPAPIARQQDQLPPSVATPTPAPGRLHADSWLIARPAGGDNLAFGQLGASQAGVRVTYALDAGRAVALSARASTPLRGAGREGAVGIDWRPTRLPVHLLIEQRVSLDTGAMRPAAQAIAGGAVRLPLGLRLDGYGQAGAIHRRGGFADAAAHLVLPVAGGDIATLDVGAGGWGAAQRGVARVDVGPTVGVTVPTRDGSVRLAVDYRVRVAGDARPGSGPAVSVGSSF